MANVYTPTINSVVTPTTRATDRHDALTVSAVAVIVFALSSVLHEFGGHGGACFIQRGVMDSWSSMHFSCMLPQATSVSERLVAAAGTVATLLGGAVALGLFYIQALPTTLRYAMWLFAAVNIMQGTGYFLFSGIGNIGDWAEVIRGAEPFWVFRLLLTVVGVVSYYWATRMFFNLIDPFVGEARPRRYEHARRLAIRAYLVGGTLTVLAGLFNPRGLELVLLSGAAATFGGTCGLAWGPQLLRGTRTPSSKLEKPVMVVRRNWPVVVVAGIVGITFIVMLGPGFVTEPLPHQVETTRNGGE